MNTSANILLKIGVCLFAVIGIGCVSQTPKLAVPKAAAIGSFEFASSEKGNRHGVKKQITDRREISALRSLIEKQNRKWQPVLQSFPTPQHRITAYDSSKNYLFVVWLGHGWIGGRDQKGANRLRAISEDDLNQFLVYGPER